MENQHIHLDKDNNNIMEIKIKFHENKISHSSTEEDIKSRESKIKFLHSELHGLRSFLESTDKDVSLFSKVEVK